MKMHLLNILNQLGANQRQKIHAVEYFKTKNVSYKNVRDFLNKGQNELLQLWEIINNS